MKPVLPFAVAAGLAIAAGPAFAQTMGNPAIGTPPHALGSPAPVPASKPGGGQTRGGRTATIPTMPRRATPPTP